MDSTLGNFGKLVKTVWSRFIVNVANINDKSYDLIKTMWDTNLDYLDSIAASGRVFIPSLNVSVPCSPIVCGGLSSFWGQIIYRQFMADRMAENNDDGCYIVGEESIEYF